MLQNGQQEFAVVRSNITKLIELHKRILSGQLPLDELKRLKQEVTQKIDLVNRWEMLPIVIYKISVVPIFEYYLHQECCDLIYYFLLRYSILVIPPLSDILIIACVSAMFICIYCWQVTGTRSGGARWQRQHTGHCRDVHDTSVPETRSHW